jgi:predicted MFS family arabinose efflux permease
MDGMPPIDAVRGGIAPASNRRLPIFGLLALTAASFISILTEALPAGLLPQISRDLGVAEAAAGQVVTAYALASLLLAIPMTLATQGLRRKPLLLAAIAGFTIGNTVTAVSNDYALTLAARFCAGTAAGLLWALLPGYASRLAPAHLQGRAIAIAMVGVSIALSLGIPAGTFVSKAIGWHATFGILSACAVGLIVWVLVGLPDFPGQAAGRRASVRGVLATPGVVAVMLATFAFVLAHNILFTFIAPFLAPAGMGDRVDVVLLAFGLAALGGIWVTGLMIDRWLRTLTLLSILLFAAAALILGLAGRSPAAIVVGVIGWGLAFGGAATLFQTALAIAAGEAADVAQSLLVVVWNCAIAGGGIVGGLLLTRAGPASFPWSLLALLVVAFAIAAGAGRHGFPKRRT